MIAIFINLDDSNPDNGGLAVFPGSHKLGPQEDTSKIFDMICSPMATTSC